MTRDLERICPLCNSDYRTIKKFFENYTVVSCDKCGLLYVADPDRATTSEKSVELSNARHTSVPSPERRHHYILNLVKMRFGDRAQILEIGAGYGPLGKLLQDRGYEYLGFEPSEVRAEVATDEGINIINKIHDPCYVNDKYDVIVLDNVIEHVRHPKEVFNNAKSNLKRGGIIITIVPSRYDLRRLHPKWNDKHFWIPDAHINFFRPSDLERLYNSTGFKMRPFPLKAFGCSAKKDFLFSIKALVEKSKWYPGSLYTFGKRIHF